MKQYTIISQTELGQHFINSSDFSKVPKNDIPYFKKCYDNMEKNILDALEKLEQIPNLAKYNQVCTEFESFNYEFSGYFDMPRVVPGYFPVDTSKPTISLIMLLLPALGLPVKTKYFSSIL